MNPATITALISESQALLADSTRSNSKIIPAFASSWITWEALRTRFIRVVIHHKVGCSRMRMRSWREKDFKHVTGRRRDHKPWPEKPSSLARTISEALETALRDRAAQASSDSWIQID